MPNVWRRFAAAANVSFHPDGGDRRCQNHGPDPGDVCQGGRRAGRSCRTGGADQWGSAETGIVRRHGAYRRQCLCWAKFQYRGANDVVRRGRSSCHPAMLRLAQPVGEAEHSPLLMPSERQTGVRQQLVRGQIARLAPIEDGLDDVRGEIAETHEPREIGSAHASRLTSATLNRRALISSLISRTSGLAVANGSMPSISILISCPQRRNRTGTDRISSSATRQWRRDIKERAEARRADRDVDPMGSDLDALYQRGKQGTLPCCGQLGPALPDVRRA